MDFFSIASSLLIFGCSGVLLALHEKQKSQHTITIRKTGIFLYGLALLFILYSFFSSLPFQALPAAIFVLGLIFLFFFRSLLLISSLSFSCTLFAHAVFISIQTKLKINAWLTPFAASTNWLGLFFLLCATNVSFLYLWQFKALKSKHLESLIVFFPALETLKQSLEVLLIIGICFLNMSLILTVTGFVINKSPSIVRLLWSFLPWGWYSCLLFLRQKNKKTKEVALGALLGVVFLFPAFFGFGFAY